jgi:predicted nucleic acid-binding protein
MTYLVDTNVLGRLANKSDLQHGVALHAVIELHRLGEILHLTPQVLVEFRSVATRPLAQNGLGVSTSDAEALATDFEAAFPLVDDTPDIFPLWKSIVAGLGIAGKQVHDARLVAVCHTHAVTHILTFNVADFGRMAQFGAGLLIVDPATI